MASINVRPTNTDNKTTRVEVVRVLARLENTALKDGRADEGNVTCTRAATAGRSTAIAAASRMPPTASRREWRPARP